MKQQALGASRGVDDAVLQRGLTQGDLTPPSADEFVEFLKRYFMPEYRAGHFDNLLAELGLRRKAGLRGGARKSVARPVRDALHTQRGGTDKDEAGRWTDDLEKFEAVALLTTYADGEAVVPRDRTLLHPYREWYRALRHRAITTPAIVTDVVPPWPSEVTMDDLAPGSTVSRAVLVTVSLRVVGVRRVRRGVYDTKVGRRTTPAPSQLAYLLVPTRHPAAAPLKLGLPEDAFDHPRGVAFRRLALELFRELPPLPEDIHQRRRRWSERHV